MDQTMTDAPDLDAAASDAAWDPDPLPVLTWVRVRLSGECRGSLNYDHHDPRCHGRIGRIWIDWRNDPQTAGDDGHDYGVLMRDVWIPNAPGLIPWSEDFARAELERLS